MNLQERLAEFGDALDKNAKESVTQYMNESLAFDKIFTNLRNKGGYLTKSKFIEMGLEWCTLAGYTDTEVFNRLERLDLDRSYLTNMLGLSDIPMKGAQQRTHLAAYIMNTVRLLEERTSLRVPHSKSVSLQFDSDGDINWTRFENLMYDIRRETDVWHLLKMIAPSENTLGKIVTGYDNPSPPMRKILKKRMSE